MTDGHENGFPAGRSEMAERIRNLDWAATPLGPISCWPSSLTFAVNLILSAPAPMALMWGERGLMLYNDAFIPIAGNRHPGSLGASVCDSWGEVAEFNRTVIDKCLAGGCLSYSDQEFTFFRYGRAEQVFLDLDYSPFHGDDGRPAGVIAIVAETTEAHRTHRLLRETRDKLAFLDALGQAIAASRDAGEVLAITTRMTGEHLGVSNCAYADMDEDEDGFTIRGNWHREDTRSIVGHYRLTDFGAAAVRELAAGRPYILDNLRELGPDEVRAFDSINSSATICMPLVKEGRLTALMAIHDSQPHAWTEQDLDIVRAVTERSWAHVERVGAEADLRATADALIELNATLEQRVKDRTQQLLEAEEILRQSQKMEAVGQLTGGIAHDFNNLLTGISGSLELIETRVARGRTADLDRYFDASHKAVKRGAALTHRLLAFSRRQTLDPRPTDVNRLIDELDELVGRTVGPAIQVECVGAVGLWPTLVDRNQLENAVLNLCINARDAMPDGGRLTVETANRWIDESAARTHDLPPGQYVCVCVTDTGTGMTPEVIAKAFEPFFTTKPLGVGTGLGLSMIYGFARQSGGQARIYSEWGQGTTVCIYLPRHDASPQEEERPENSAPVLAGEGEVVLVIDDEQTIRMLATEVLSDAGYMVMDAADGPAGLRLITSDTRIDLLVTDVGLPGGMNGREVADAARAARPDLKILFITGYAENAAIGNGYLDGRMAVLTKPFQMDALAAKVRDLIAGQ
ncbi:MAG: response regulator [Sphingobium sp.]